MQLTFSGSRETLEELFPEMSHALQDSRPSLAWNTANKHVIRCSVTNGGHTRHVKHIVKTRIIFRFPLNGFCKVTALQVMSQLLNAGYELRTSNGGVAGGAESQMAEYVFTRQITPQ